MFMLSKHSQFTITELEEMMPFEVEIFTEMVLEEIKKLKEAG